MTTIRYRRATCAIVLACAVGLVASGAQAQTLGSNATGYHDGFYYTFWKDSGDATMTLLPGGRYASQWTGSTNNWVGGKGWNPGGPRVVHYSGHYGVDDTQNSYLALYGWTRSPLIEYYVVESYGSYNPASCTGGVDYGSFQSDGATYRVRRCERVDAPSIEGTRTFYQYFSVRTPKKGFGNISGTITVANHFDYWASRGLALGSHDYMVVASEGYRSRGSSDITVSEAPRRILRTGSQPLQPGMVTARAAQAAPPMRARAAGSAAAAAAAPAPAPASASASASAPTSTPAASSGQADRSVPAAAPVARTVSATSAAGNLWARLRAWFAPAARDKD